MKCVELATISTRPTHVIAYCCSIQWPINVHYFDDDSSIKAFLCLLKGFSSQEIDTFINHLYYKFESLYVTNDNRFLSIIL